LATYPLLRRLLLPVAIVFAAFALGGAVYTAANTVPNSTAGEGSNTVSGYTISSIVYNLNAADPRDVDTITFIATADNGSLVAVLPNIDVNFETLPGWWYECTRTGGVAPAHNISCDTTVGQQLTVVNITRFDIVITE
jgi:hypothetical protein